MALLDMQFDDAVEESSFERILVSSEGTEYIRKWLTFTASADLTIVADARPTGLRELRLMLL